MSAGNGGESTFRFDRGIQTEDRSAEAHQQTALERAAKAGNCADTTSACSAASGVCLSAPLPPALPSSPDIPRLAKKKRVLLVDTSEPKRELRAEVMRKLGMDVDCAADIREARSWWRAALYDLVLVNMEKGLGHRDRFCDEVRTANPPQRLAFLVGQPEYLAGSPHGDQELPVENCDDHHVGDWKAAFAARGDLVQHWGILEASRRIFAVRSASVSRTRAMQTLSAPPQDSEGHPLNSTLREELQ